MQNSPLEIYWSFARKFLFRFFFVYLFIYCFPFPFDSFEFTKPIAQPYYNFLDFIIPRIGQSWFQLKAKTAFPMFDKVDDSYYGLVHLYTTLVISFIATIIWSIIDRRRKNYEVLRRWLRLYLRFFLAAYLFGYGFVKIFPSQFQPITAFRLTQTVGDQSPMLLAWNFMGYSSIFQKILGITEVVAGLFLLFRRTTTIGAILSFGVFGFVVMMDFSFNVPVRLLSSHLLFISAFLFLGDGNRLMNIFFLNRPAAAVIEKPLITHPLYRNVFSGILIILGICLFYSQIIISRKSEKEFGWKAPQSPLYGVYNTTYFIRNNDTIPPFQTDSLRWKQLVIDGGAWNQLGVVKVNSDKRITYKIEADTTKHILKINLLSDTTEKYSFNYSKPDAEHLLINGVWKKDTIKVLMDKYDLNNYLLHKEKFTWINE